MRRVIYDYQAFAMQRYGGISRYFSELIRQLRGSYHIDPILPIRYADNTYLTGKLGIQTTSWPYKHKESGARYMKEYADYVNQRMVRTALKNDDKAIVHPTYYHPYLLENSLSVPLVITIHDMIYELFPELHNDSSVVQQKHDLIERANQIVSVSESTRQDLLRIYPDVADKVSVIHHGASFTQHIETDKPFVKIPYVLFVGNREAYKNFTTGAKAFALLASDYPDLALICAGGGAFTDAEEQLFTELGMSGRVQQVSVNDAQLKNLYYYSKAFVYPSLYEGFGLPVLEAMACGAPCLLSDVSSLPEVGAAAAIYFDPLNDQMIAESIERVLRDMSLAGQMSEAGLVRVEQFTWEKSARRHEEVYCAL